jgi:putative PIN family toxin of toxin-antitoxin system
VIVRAVIDTQIIIRGIVRRRQSAAGQVFDLALAGELVRGVTSPLLLDELRRVLKRDEIRKLTEPPLEDALIERAVAYVGQRFEVVPGLFVDVDKVPDDAKDNPLVEAALEAEVPSIVSDDRDLKSLKVIQVAGFRAIQIYAPGPFLKHVTGDSS